MTIFAPLPTNPSYVRRVVLANYTVAKVKLTNANVILVEEFGAAGKWRELGRMEDVLAGIVQRKRVA